MRVAGKEDESETVSTPSRRVQCFLPSPLQLLHKSPCALASLTQARQAFCLSSKGVDCVAFFAVPAALTAGIAL
jgi:hypothetical protein